MNLALVENTEQRERYEAKLKRELGSVVLAHLNDPLTEDILLNPDSVLWAKRLGEGFVQIGDMAHNHPPLVGALDMRGKTTHRELFRLVYHAEGVLTCVSYPMHIAAALMKPCVVVAGGRESTRWELYPNHRFLHTNGALSCCGYDGCWRNTITDCSYPVVPIVGGRPNALDGGEYAVSSKTEDNVPKCMEMIKPRTIVDAIELYYEGGVLQPEVKHV